MKAVVLLSGGLDSATALAVAQRDGFECYPLCISYGQRHYAEAEAARLVAYRAGLDLQETRIPLDELAVSALTTANIPVPKDRTEKEIGHGVPSTYVPARNTVLLALALAYAESLGARTIFTGFNVLDASGYPDCTPPFVNAFESLADVATREQGWSIRAPLILLTKAQIIKLGTELGVDYSITHSCYDPIYRAPEFANTKFAKILAAVSKRQRVLSCGHCDACQLRRKGFAEAGLPDPTAYV